MATSKTEPEATRKLSHFSDDPSTNPPGVVLVPLEPERAKAVPSTAGVGFGVVLSGQGHASRGLIDLEGVIAALESGLASQRNKLSANATKRHQLPRC